MKVTAILKGNKDSLGRKTVYIRINDGEKRTFRATNIKLMTTQLKKSVVIDHPQSKLFNQLIRDQILNAEVNKMFVGSNDNFFDYSEKSLSGWINEKSKETVRQYRSELNKITAFASDTLKLSQITPEWLFKYKIYLYEKGQTTNTLWKSFKFVRLIILKAWKEKKIKDNPFQVFDMPKYKDPPKVYLTKKQVEKIDKYAKDKKTGSELKISATWFVIAAYTGLRFGDMRAFDKAKHISNGRLVIYTSKTKEVVGMPVNDKLKALFERIGYKPLPWSNAHYNRLLKVVAVHCDIDTLTAHQSRHTFALMCADAGISQEVTAKLLGHNTIKTTAIYYKISNVRIDQEVQKIF